MKTRRSRSKVRRHAREENTVSNKSMAMSHAYDGRLDKEIATAKRLCRSDFEAAMKLRKSTVHHERCRAVAELIWSMEPDLTTVEMAQRSEIIKYGCEGHQYHVRTVCRWLASIKDYRRPGRPCK
jgi:hypothetical protein